MTAPKVSLYSLPDLKNTLDDHLPIYLTSPNLLTTSGPALAKSLRFTQTYTHILVRLGLGYTAVAIAAYLFYLDWYLKVPFSQHKRIAAPSVIVYFLLNGALQAWIWFRERGMIFEGKRKEKGSGKKTTLTVYSRQPHRKYDPIYRLAVKTGVDGRPEGKELEFTAPFTKFFAADGTFAPNEYETWLRESVSVLADPSGSTPAPAVSTTQPLYTDAEKVEEEDAVFVESPLVGATHVSARQSGSALSAGKKRSKKKA